MSLASRDSELDRRLRERGRPENLPVAEPNTITFVARGRPRTLGLFAGAGFPASFELTAVEARSIPPQLPAVRQAFIAPAL
jgi:hypothetical protein